MKVVRSKRIKGLPKASPTTGHEHYAKYSAALPIRAALARQSLAAFNLIFKSLLSDENFRTLMRAESMTIPSFLMPLLQEKEKECR